MARRIVLTSESLVRLTCHVTAFRFRLENERNERQKLMALQIKGLRENMLALRGLVSELNGQTAGAIEKGTQLKGHIGDLSTELAAHVSDIEFAAGLMGNSGGGSNGSEKSKESLGEKQVIKADEVGKIAVAPPLVRLEPDPSMPETTEGAIWLKSPRSQEAGEAERLRTEFLDGKITAEERAAAEKLLWEAGQAAAATFPGNKL